MTGTIDHADTPEFPAPRAATCPFDPPPAMQALREETRLARVRLPNGQTPWLVTRYEDQRALLSDSRVSSDVTHPGYPSGLSIENRGTPISFILMDDPEHARLRRMVTAPFMIKRIEAMRPGVQKTVDQDRCVGVRTVRGSRHDRGGRLTPRVSLSAPASCVFVLPRGVLENATRGI